MKKLDVYDPPMCCSSGVCGLKVDPVLLRFAGDLEWLKAQGVVVTRYNLVQQSLAFAENAVVRDALEKEDVACLPLILVNGSILRRASYPDRNELVAWLNIHPVDRSVTPETALGSCCCAASKGSTEKQANGC